MIERVENGSDRFESEVFSEQVTQRLGTLADQFRRADLTSLGGVLAPTFRGSAIGVGSSDDSAVDGGAWRQSLVTLRAGFASIEKAKFKVFRVGRDPARENRRTARVLLEFDGRVQAGGAGDASRGSYRQVRTIWDTVWGLQGENWLLDGLLRVSFESSSADSRAFRDVSTATLGAIPAYREQLSRGVGYWRTRVDSTTGIDVYGHQGIAVGDVDGDGLEDFYVPQPAGLPNRLFRNLGARAKPGAAFEEIAHEAGVDILDNTGGALLVDLDNDGDSDLIAVTSLEVLLFENTGGGKFRPRDRSGLDSIELHGASTLGATAADYDLDGDLDVYVFSYVFWAGSASKTSSSYPYPYHDANNGAPNFLFRNEGGLKFRDVTKSSGIGENNLRFSLAASWADYDEDGDPDLYVANDFGKNNLYRNEGGGKFRDVEEELGVEDTGNGMSVTWEDVDGDGRIDLYVGNMWSSAGSRIAGQPEFEAQRLRELYLRMSRGNSLFRNLGGGKFAEVPLAGGAQFARWSWSGQFLDVEGDGFEDLYVVNGFISGPKKDDL